MNNEQRTNATREENAPLDARIRCDWCGQDPLYVAYHDTEWGAPLHDDQRLFEFLVLEGAQAGLNWLTILRKRSRYREAFAHFNIDRVASFDARDVGRLLENPGIVRNRLKIESAINNARRTIEARDAHGSLDALLWRYVEGKPAQRLWRSLSEVPTRSDASDLMSRDLKRLGFTFVGPTICYALMQATGMVNDHLAACFRRRELAPS